MGMTSLFLLVALAQAPKIKVEPVWTFYPVCLKDKRTRRLDRGVIRCLNGGDKPSSECLERAKKNSDPALEIVDCAQPNT